LCAVRRLLFCLLSLLRRLYKMGFGLTIGFIGLHTIYSAYTLQLTTTESLLFFWRLRLQICNQSQSQSYFTTDDQSVSKSWFQGPWGFHDRIFISVVIYEYCLSITGAPSDERSGLSFIIVVVSPLIVNIYRFTCNVHVSYKYTYI
jgi:hypothetical protein